MKPLRFVCTTVAWFGVSQLQACSESPVAVQIPAVTAFSVEVAQNQLAASVHIGLDSPAEIEVEYGTAGQAQLRQISESGDAHVIQLMRLLADRDYSYVARVVVAPGQFVEVASGTFVSPPLPEFLADVQLNATGRTTQQLTMLELIDDLFSAFVIVDDSGSIVWYWQTEGIPHSWERGSDGYFYVMDLGFGLRVLSPNGTLMADLPSTAERRMHHDMELMSDNSVVFIANELQSVRDTVWAGEALWRWDPITGATAKLWSAFDFMDPATDRGPRSNPNDWIHANSLDIGPTGNLVVSSPYLSQVFSIAPDYGSLQWRLGGPGSSFAVDSTALFSGQHTATHLTENSLLLFDNGVSRPDSGKYSRGLELNLDFASMTAHHAWEFRPPTDNHAQFVSSAWRLANGNTVVGFGLSGVIAPGTNGIEVYEVTRDGEIQWHLMIDGITVMYRASPLMDIAGEQIILQ